MRVTITFVCHILGLKIAMLLTLQMWQGRIMGIDTVILMSK